MLEGNIPGKNRKVVPELPFDLQRVISGFKCSNYNQMVQMTRDKEGWLRQQGIAFSV